MIIIFIFFQKIKVDPIEQDNDIEWTELDNIEKEIAGVKSDVSVTPEKSLAKPNCITKTPTKSPIKPNNINKTPKKSPTKPKNINKTPKKSSTKPNNINKTPKKSPAKSNCIEKTLGASPIKNKNIQSQKTSPLSKSSKFKLYSNTVLESKIKSSDNGTTTAKTGFKRKISPKKTPENKKFKVNSAQSPNTQVSDIIVIIYLYLINGV